MEAVRVQVRFFTYLADHAGAKQARLELPAGTTVRELILRLVSERSPSFAKIVLRGEEVHPFLRVFHNQSLLSTEQIAATVLQDGDELMLYPAISGG